MAFIRIEQIAAAAFALLMALSWPAMAQDKPAAAPIIDKPFAEHHLALQLSDSDPKKQALVLSVAYNLLKYYGPDRIAIEVVTFGPGIDLVRAGNANRSQVDSLISQGVQFDVCMNTVDTIERETGKKVDLNPRAVKVVAGVAQILALTEKGPRVIEFNVRFGDPDIQPVLAVLESPLGELLAAAAAGRLVDVPAPVFGDGAAVTVVLASAGYPESSSKGDVITGVDAAAAQDGVDVVHAGTARDGDDLVTSGGRVLAVRAVGSDVADARARSYAAADLIAFDGLQRRTDIAAEPLGVVEGASVAVGE